MRADPYLPKYLESTFSQRMVSQTLGIDLLGVLFWYSLGCQHFRELSTLHHKYVCVWGYVCACMQVCVHGCALVRASCEGQRTTPEDISDVIHLLFLNRFFLWSENYQAG